jgi:hypothetical protein
VHFAPAIQAQQKQTTFNNNNMSGDLWSRRYHRQGYEEAAEEIHKLLAEATEKARPHLAAGKEFKAHWDLGAFVASAKRNNTVDPATCQELEKYYERVLNAMTTWRLEKMQYDGDDALIKRL